MLVDFCGHLSSNEQGQLNYFTFLSTDVSYVNLLIEIFYLLKRLSSFQLWSIGFHCSLPSKLQACTSLINFWLPTAIIVFDLLSVLYIPNLRLHQISQNLDTSMSLVLIQMED